MIYKHEFFRLDTDSQKVFDENGKELYLTGNPYRMLAFLCQKQNAKLSDIGQALDWARDYNEEHLRQYRYKINTLVGRKVVDYRNGVYTIAGNIDVIERNTDLIRPPEQELNSMDKKIGKSVPLYFFPAVIAAALLLIGLARLPYGYFTLLRIVVTIVAIYYAYYVYSNMMGRGIWFWTLLLLAALFNPIIPIYLYSRDIWHPIDILVAVFLIVMAIYFGKTDRAKERT